MKLRIKLFTATAILSVCLCVSAFGGSIPTIPEPTPVEPEPTPTSAQSSESGQTSEDDILTWLLGLIIGE